MSTHVTAIPGRGVGQMIPPAFTAFSNEKVERPHATANRYTSDNCHCAPCTAAYTAYRGGLCGFSEVWVDPNAEISVGRPVQAERVTTRCVKKSTDTHPRRA